MIAFQPTAHTEAQPIRRSTGTTEKVSECTTHQYGAQTMAAQRRHRATVSDGGRGMGGYGTGSYRLCLRACWYEGVFRASDARLSA